MKYIVKAPNKIIFTCEQFVIYRGYAFATATDRCVWTEDIPSSDTMIKSLKQKAILPDKVPERLLKTAEVLKTTFRYLEEKKGVDLVIDSDLPASSGLALSGATAAASLAAASASGQHIPIEKLVELAIVSERLVHGNPSGIDVYTSAYGGGFLFRRGDIQEL